MPDAMVPLAHGAVVPATVAGPDDAPLVVLLHGFPQDRSAWDEVVPPLAEAGLRVVAPDQRGYAASFRPAGREAYAIENLADDVVALADGLGAGRFHLVGHDWGGILAWVLAARRPERLVSVTSVSTPHPGALRDVLLRSDQALRSAYVPVFRVPWVAERLLLAGGGRPLRRLLVATGLPPDGANRYVEAMQAPGALTAALSWYRAASPRLSSLAPAVPSTLLVWGDRDASLGRAAAEATGAHVAGSYRFEPLDGVSHWVPETAPARLVPLLLTHLGANGLTGPTSPATPAP